MIKKPIDTRAFMNELNETDLVTLNVTVAHEKNGDRVAAAVVEMCPELRDLELHVAKLNERLEACKGFVSQLTRDSMDEVGWFDAAGGYEVKKIKAHLAGLVSVKVDKAAKKTKVKRACTTSRSRSESPCAPPSRGMFSWF